MLAVIDLIVHHDHVYTHSTAWHDAGGVSHDGAHVRGPAARAVHAVLVVAVYHDTTMHGHAAHIEILLHLGAVHSVPSQ